MKKIKDERIIMGKRKIQSQAFGLSFIGLWLILLYRQFILNQPISEYLDIFLLTIGISFYVTLNNVIAGFYVTYRDKQTKTKITIISGLVSALTFSIIQFTISNKILSNTKDLISTIAGSIIFFLIWIFLQSKLLSLSEKQSNKDID